MPTFIFFWAIRLNTLNDMPGTSGTSSSEMTATFSFFVTPLMSIPSTCATSLTMVPGTSVSDERTSSSTEYFLASSTRGCSAPARPGLPAPAFRRMISAAACAHWAQGAGLPCTRRLRPYISGTGLHARAAAMATGACVRAAAPQRGDVIVFVDALKARHHHHAVA